MNTNLKITPNCVKQKLPPSRFYNIYLPGSFGHPTGNGWHTWNGLCPFHDDKKTGSFVVNKHTGGFHCFSCGAKGGDIFDFYMQLERLNFKAALTQLGRVATCEK